MHSINAFAFWWVLFACGCGAFSIALYSIKYRMWGAALFGIAVAVFALLLSIEPLCVSGVFCPFPDMLEGRD
jgi:hypothetical protein